MVLCLEKLSLPKIILMIFKFLVLTLTPKNPNKLLELKNLKD